MGTSEDAARMKRTTFRHERRRFGSEQEEVRSLDEAILERDERGCSINVAGFLNGYIGGGNYAVEEQG